MHQVEIRYGAATDVGRVREVNEDAHLARPPVFVVADGMGGHEGGDVASAIVVEEFGRLAESGYDPRRGVEAISETLAACADRIGEYAAAQRAAGVARGRSAGTTAVVALLVEAEDGPAWLLANLGDSRVYRYAEGHLAQVSTDHSLVQELVDAGQLAAEDAATHPERNVITRALGESTRAQPDFFVLPATPGERLVLCSDGVSGMVDDEGLEQILAACSDTADAADRLVRAAVAAGGEDNATAVVVEVVASVDETAALA
ncbi:protein phosphatase 2C domain-containing protein [Nocardioides sp.]|uniref:PP2C family protein-serine/threonine phosphatase n=1 Tax=Nocardioides sp. TaxID=35761 RepID=UPI0025F53DE1|nr:protein phosphatase 2C domain-containing protein [Nocardioides sp.]